MRTTAVEDGGDFLRRLSVADAKVLLERTRKEKEAKTKEMQKMIGVRYRDLIESADKIVTMHSAAMRLEVSLKEMPNQWKRVEAQLQNVLTSSSRLVAQVESNDQVEPASNISNSVHFVVTAHDQLWEAIDKGHTLQALQLFERVRDFFESKIMSDAEKQYPFLPSIWASVRGFQPRLISVATTSLTCRGEDSTFYADNLMTLALLEPHVALLDLLDRFLAARTEWLELERPSNDIDMNRDCPGFDRQLRINLTTLMWTVVHAQAIFFLPTEPSVAFHRHYEKELKDSDTSQIIINKLMKWFSNTMTEIREHASIVIDLIPTIAQIAKWQATLTSIDHRFITRHNYPQLSLWISIASSVDADYTSNNFTLELLYGSAFRKRTRDLVQNSFETALESIKTTVRELLPRGDETNRPRLTCLAFYDYFESIHQKVAGLDSKELQRVLMEEYLRTLFNFILFLEKEYPYQRTSQTKSHNDTQFALANLLIGIVTEFPKRLTSVFGLEKTQTHDAINDSSREINEVHRQVFETYASHGSVQTKIIDTVFKELGSAPNMNSTFLDEEVHAVSSIGYVAFYLVAEVKCGHSYPIVFVNSLSALALSYCQSWVQELLQQKMEPLHDVLQSEQYDQTNDEWVAQHQGWSEQVICVDEDEEDPSEEKVWLPWCETPTVSSVLFSCCYALDEAYRQVQRAKGATILTVQRMHSLIRTVLIELLTIKCVDVYEEALNLLIQAKAKQNRGVLNFGECCILQFLFDMYFVRATLGFSDFVRFGWGDEIDPETSAPSLQKLKKLFDRMHEFIDPVDWEIYGPQLVENVVIQFRKSRLLFSSLSESSDINEINGKPIVISAQDTRPIVKILEPIARFSLLPVPTTRRRAAQSIDNSSTLVSTPLNRPYFHDMGKETKPLSSLKLQNILSSSTGSNLLSAAATGSNLLSNAAKGITSYLREGDNPSI